MSSFFAGLFLGGSLIVAIGAQNAFVLRQGLRREHVPMVVALCAVLDAALISIGVGGLAASVGERRGALDALAVVGAAFLAWYGAAALRRALAPQTLQAQAAGHAQPMRRVLAQTLGVTLLNPHVYLDTVLLVGAIGAQQPAGMKTVFVAGAATASAAWFASLGFGARLLAPAFARPLAWRLLGAAVAATMWAIAARLLIDRFMAA